MLLRNRNKNAKRKATDETNINLQLNEAQSTENRVATRAATKRKKLTRDIAPQKVG